MRRTTAAAIGAAGLVLAGWFAWREHTAAEEERRKAAIGREQEAARAAKAEAQQRADDAAASAEAARSAAALAQAEKEQDARRATYRSLAPATRLATMRTCFTTSGCDPEALLDAAATPAERRALLGARREDLRVRFAVDLDRRLLDEHMNPDGVEVVEYPIPATARGGTVDVRRDGQPPRTTLLVRGALCSRQWVWDFLGGPNGKAARDLGFWTVECTNGLETWPGAIDQKL